MIDDPEEFAWQQLEAKQNKAKALAQTESWDTSDMAYRPNGLSVEQSKNPLDIADRAYFAGKKDGIEETLAQPEQEPVAYLNYDNTLTIIGTIPKSNTPIPLYLRNNREFVVLTDDEVDKLCMAFMGQLHKPSFARAIEAALRSKNDRLG